MAMPSNLQFELTKLRQQQRGTRFWLLFRVLFTVCMLQGPLLRDVLNRSDWWSIPVAIGILGTVGLLWWLAALTFESERSRIETKKPGGIGGGWRGVLPMVLMAVAFVLTIRPFNGLGLPSVVLSLFVFGALIFVFEQTLAAKRASFDLLEAREQVLRARLAPHFIFNTLNTLHAQIEQDPRGAQATTERLAQLFRQVIEASDQVTIPLKQDLAFVEAYLGIEQARLGDRLRVSIQIPEELESALVPPLSLQVLVENAVKHGVAPLEQGGEVRIGGERQDASLRLWVEDPGQGFSHHRGTGTALDTLRQRLERPEDLEMGMVDGVHRVGFRWRQA
jgi:two-component system sensor histidine kinase AlgZ